MSYTVEVLDYNDLVANVDLSEQIIKAYGTDGLGILTVKNVPGLVEAREKLLTIGRKFALLDPAIQRKYEHPASHYQQGWSRGVETLDGKPDVSKGSYYANPQYDHPIDDEALIAEFPSFYLPNIWPTEDMPELQDHFKTMGCIMVEVGKLVARQCDQYIKSQIPTYQENRFQTVINESKACTGRLLHYYPIEGRTVGDEDDGNFSSWCGWHNDHGSLTALLSAMYMNEKGEVVENTDPAAGLYARSRKSELVKVNIPADHLAFQIGEAQQIHSGGLMQATPHAVRGSRVPGVSRETFAVFMEPNSWDMMDIPAGVDPSAAQSQAAAANLPSGVPPIASRWDPSMTFGQFTKATLQMYH